MSVFTQVLKATLKKAGKKIPNKKDLSIADYKANSLFDASELEKALDPKLKTGSKELLQRTRDRAIIQGIIEPDNMGGVPSLESINDVIKTVKFDRFGSGKDPRLDKNSTRFEELASELGAIYRAGKAVDEGAMDIGNVRKGKFFEEPNLKNPVDLFSRAKARDVGVLGAKIGFGAGVPLGFVASRLTGESKTDSLMDENQKLKAQLEELQKLQELYNQSFSGEAPSRFKTEFSQAVKEGKSSFLFTNDEGETQEIKVAIASEDNPDIEFVPRKKESDGGLQNPEKADLDNDGQLSSYEKARGSAIEKSMSERKQAQEGGGINLPIQTENTEETADLPPEVLEDSPQDTYPNATPEEIRAANQRPDEEMEEDYIEFVVSESLNEDEQTYLMNALEADPQLSMIFDKVIETASEFSGAGEVEGPGTGLTDSIPARLSDGEFVMTKKATDQIGADNLQRMMDDAERAFDGGMMREKRQIGGAVKAQDDDEMELVTGGTRVDDEIKKLMSLKANKAPSLS